MKPILLAALIIGLASCQKEKEIMPAPPEMRYTNLSNRVVNITTPGGIDISGDGVSDVWFEIWHTTDDAQTQDVHQFTITSGEHSQLLANTQDATPVLSQGNPLKLDGNTGYEWKSPVLIELAKRTLIRHTSAPTWEGAWKDAQHKFLAVQVWKDGKPHNGWIEFSFDKASEKIVFYRSGISKEAGKDIIVGL